MTQQQEKIVHGKKSLEKQLSEAHNKLRATGHAPTSHFSTHVLKRLVNYSKNSQILSQMFF
jgi:nucleosome binding factor SPN SPT16 subunit